MHKNIMIISSDYTGHGHKSITEAIVEQFSKYTDVTVNIIDGYSLSGSLGLRIGKMYGFITRTSKDLWKMIWDISIKKPSLIIELVENTIESRLLRTLEMLKPDAIVVTHPNYNSPVLNILERKGIKTPVYALVADPVSIGPLWCDARAHFTLCPTEETRVKCLEYGIPESRIRVFGFPVRERFCRYAALDSPRKHDPDKPLNCMIMSGGEGSGNMSRIARILLRNFNCNIKIICGRNRFLKKRLEHTLVEKYGNRVEILGFIDNIQELMAESDILFTRASPNVMMEALMCNVPLVITGSLPGQEEGNPAFAEKYGIGTVCSDTKKLKQVLGDLLKNNSSMLDSIRKKQCDFRKPLSASDIAEFIINS